MAHVLGTQELSLQRFVEQVAGLTRWRWRVMYHLTKNVPKRAALGCGDPNREPGTDCAFFPTTYNEGSFCKHTVS
jgi:hypothetical protein